MRYIVFYVLATILSTYSYGNCDPDNLIGVIFQPQNKSFSRSFDNNVTAVMLNKQIQLSFADGSRCVIPTPKSQTALKLCSKKVGNETVYENWTFHIDQDSQQYSIVGVEAKVLPGAVVFNTSVCGKTQVAAGPSIFNSYIAGNWLISENVKIYGSTLIPLNLNEPVFTQEEGQASKKQEVWTIKGINSGIEIWDSKIHGTTAIHDFLEGDIGKKDVVSKVYLGFVEFSGGRIEGNFSAGQAFIFNTIIKGGPSVGLSIFQADVEGPALFEGILQVSCAIVKGGSYRATTIVDGLYSLMTGSDCANRGIFEENNFTGNFDISSTLAKPIVNLTIQNGSRTTVFNSILGVNVILSGATRALNTALSDNVQINNSWIDGGSVGLGSHISGANLFNTHVGEEVSIFSGDSSTFQNSQISDGSYLSGSFGLTDSSVMGVILEGQISANGYSFSTNLAGNYYCTPAEGCIEFSKEAILSNLAERKKSAFLF